MKYSIQLFGLPPEQFAPIVQRADELGFETAWLSDHVVTPLNYERRYPYSDNGDPGYSIDTPLTDVVVTLSHLAALTPRIRLAAGVFVLPLRNPFHVASAWGTLQNLSGGRAVLGIGGGWMEEEFAAIGMPFRGRGRRLDEMLDVLDLLWSGEAVDYSGEHFQFEALRFGVQPMCPLPRVFGGHGERALRRAAQRGDGWFGPNVDLATSVGYRDNVERLRAELGRDGPFTHYVRLHGDLGPDLVDRYAEAGFDQVVVSPFGGLAVDAAVEDRLRRLDEVSEVLGVVPGHVAAEREAAE